MSQYSKHVSKMAGFRDVNKATIADNFFKNNSICKKKSELHYETDCMTPLIICQTGLPKLAARVPPAAPVLAP
jgi:hypothetical protein